MGVGRCRIQSTNIFLKKCYFPIKNEFCRILYLKIWLSENVSSRNMTMRNCEFRLMCDNPLILYSKKINIENMKFINYQLPKYKMYEMFYSTKKIWTYIKYSYVIFSKYLFGKMWNSSKNFRRISHYMKTTFFVSNILHYDFIQIHYYRETTDAF